MGAGISGACLQMKAHRARAERDVFQPQHVQTALLSSPALRKPILSAGGMNPSTRRNFRAFSYHSLRCLVGVAHSLFGSHKSKDLQTSKIFGLQHGFTKHLRNQELVNIFSELSGKKQQVVGSAHQPFQARLNDLQGQKTPIRRWEPSAQGISFYLNQLSF